MPVLRPMLLGTNATEMEQAESGLRELPQALVAVKSPEVIWAAMWVRAASPELVRVICWVGLEVLSCWVAKVRLRGLRESVAGRCRCR